MISTLRGLVVAAAVAVALVVAVIVDAARTPEAVDRALMPGSDPAQATELVWERPGRPVIRAERAGGGWQLRVADDPRAVPADAGAISDVLAALRGARWHRRGEAPAPHATLSVTAGGARHVFGIAAPIAGTEQGWIVDDGRGVVVDSWVARALDRDRLALQVSRPLAEAAAAGSIGITGRLAGPVADPSTGPASRSDPVTGSGARPAPARPRSGADADAAGAARAPGTASADAASAATEVDLALSGTPRRLVRPTQLLLAPAPAAALERALRDVTIVRIPDGVLAGHGLAIALEAAGRAGKPAAVTLELGGDCPGAPELVAASGSAGSGCVERAAVAAVEAAAAALQQAAEAIVERRPVPFEPARIALADGALLEMSPLRIGDAAADPARVAELLAALAAPAEVARVPAGAPIGHIVATDRTGASIALDLFADRLLVRRAEPVALREAPGAWRALVQPARELRDPTLWLEEPTTVAALVIDGLRYERGAVIGAWSRRLALVPGSGSASPGASVTAAAVPVDAAQAARIEALVAQLAAPRALGFVDGQIAAAHVVAIEVVPPVGAPIHHEIAVAAPGSGTGGCPARAGHDSVRLPATICAEVAALTARK